MSRSAARSLILGGQVCVDGIQVRDASCQVGAQSVIGLGADLIPGVEPAHQYLVYHKMLGEVCSREDAHHPLVFRHFNDNMRHPLMTVGRLDQDTTGLLLLTTDGRWSHRVRRPGHHHKCYEVTLSESCLDSVQDQVLAGVKLEDEHRPVQVQRIERMASNQFRLWIDEGRYHVVRRLWAALGYHVVGLHRSSLGPLHLDIELGQWRPLTQAEVDLF